MTEDDLRTKLDASLQIRVPTFERGTSPRIRIDQLEEAMLVNAWHAAELAELRFGLLDEKRPLDDDWLTLHGWESVKSSSRRTEAGVDEAKTRLNPALAQQRRDLAWWISRLTEEIDRLERDATKCSRAYAMISGS